MSTLFELSGGPLVGLDDISVGPWVQAPRPSSGPLTFAAGFDDEPGEASDEPPRWRVDVDDSNLDQVFAEFDRGDQGLAHTERKVDEVLARITGALATGNSNTPVPPDARIPSAESELIMDLGAPGSSGPVTFGSSDDSAWDAMAEKAKAALDSISRVATQAAWIETCVAGSLVASTTVSWTGDTSNFATPRLSSRLIRVHSRSVSMSIRTRNAWSRLLVTVLQGSAMIATSIGSAVGAVKALPMAWSFIRRVLEEIKQLRAVRAGGAAG